MFTIAPSTRFPKRSGSSLPVPESIQYRSAERNQRRRFFCLQNIMADLQIGREVLSLLCQDLLATPSLSNRGFCATAEPLEQERSSARNLYPDSQIPNPQDISRRALSSRKQHEIQLDGWYFHLPIKEPGRQPLPRPSRPVLLGGSPNASWPCSRIYRPCRSFHGQEPAALMQL